MVRRVGLVVLLATSCEGLQNMQYRTLQQQKVGVQHEVVQVQQQQNQMTSQKKESRSILLHPSCILIQILVALGFLAAGDKSDVDPPDPIREAAGPATADLGDIVEGGEDAVPAVIDVAMAPAAAAAAAVEENIGVAEFLQQNGTTMGMIFLTAAFIQCMLAICTRTRDDDALTPMNASKHIAALFAMANGGGQYISESSFFHNLDVQPPNPENRFFRCCCFFCDRSKQPNCICIGLCPFCTAYAYEGCSVITIICLILMMTGYGFYGGFVFFILACCFWNPVRWGVNYPEDMVGSAEAASV